ncbi:MAG: enoyl-CoA hydratase/isomerase family protein [Desulfarculaceae bacterium]|nr:enoyl-CoA hydratase/isomerase family protein [Desulfarculaceae bacterium]
MSDKTVLIQDQGPVRVLTLNRPEQLNALNHELGQELMDALAEAENDPKVRAVVLTGAGRAFSAGADLGRFAAMAAQQDSAARESFTGLGFPRAMANFPKPLIAAVNGPAVGWGLTVSLMCDLRVAAAESYFSAGFVRIGVTPEFGSSFLLPAIVGLGRALDMTLTARKVPAEEALAMGLVNRVAPEGQLMEAALELAGQIAAYPATAVSMAKTLMRTGAGAAMEQVLDYEIRCFRSAMTSPEHKAAVKAMMESIAARKKG